MKPLKAFLVFLVLLGFGFSLAGWEKIFGTTGYEEIFDLIIDSNKIYTVMRTSYGDGYYSGGYLVLDTDGNILVSKWNDTHSYVYPSSIIKNGSYIWMVLHNGSSVFLKKLDLNGNEIEDYTFSRSIYLLLSDGTYNYAIGSQDYIKFNNSGAVSWHKRPYDGSQFYNIGYNDGLIINSSIYTVGGSDQVLAQINTSTGELNFRKSYGDLQLVGITTDESYLYILGQYSDGSYWHSVVIKVDLSGDVISAKDLYVSSGNLYARTKGIVYLDGYLFVALYYYDSQGDFVIVKLRASDLSLINYKTYGDSSNTQAYGPLATDGNYIYVAGAYVQYNSSDSDFYIIRINPDTLNVSFSAFSQKSITLNIQDYSVSATSEAVATYTDSQTLTNTSYPYNNLALTTKSFTIESSLSVFLKNDYNASIKYLDFENNTNTVDVNFVATFNKISTILVYYRFFNEDSNETYKEVSGVDADSDYVVIDFNTIGDKNICVYARAEDSSSNIYEDTACNVITVNQAPQNLTLDVNSNFIFENETAKFIASAEDNDSLTYKFYIDGNLIQDSDSNVLIYTFTEAKQDINVFVEACDSYNVCKTKELDINVYQDFKFKVSITDIKYSLQILSDANLYITKVVLLDKNIAFYNIDSIVLYDFNAHEDCRRVEIYLSKDDENKVKDYNLDAITLDLNIEIGIFNATNIHSATVRITTDNNLTCNLNIGNTSLSKTYTTSTTETISNVNVQSSSVAVSAICTDLNDNITTYNRTYNTIYKHLEFVDELTGVKKTDYSNTYSSVLYRFAIVSDQNVIFETTTFATDLYIFLEEDATILVEQDYNDQEFTLREEFDTDLMQEDTKICLTDYTSFVGQTFYSSTQRAIAIKSLYGQCYKAMTRTKYPLQDAYALYVYTRATLYYIYTYDSSGNLVLLGSINGELQNSINIDVLEFTQRKYEITIQESVITTEKTDDTTLKIYYYNPKQDNESVKISIYNPHTSELLFIETVEDNPNEVQLYFNYTGLDVNDVILLQAEETKTDGSTNTIKRYIDLESGSVGSWSPTASILLAVFTLVFITTAVATSRVFGFFGIIGAIFAILLLSLAPLTWAVKLFISITLIFIGFVFIISKYETMGMIT